MRYCLNYLIQSFCPLKLLNFLMDSVLNVTSHKRMLKSKWAWFRFVLGLSSSFFKKISIPNIVIDEIIESA